MNSLDIQNLNKLKVQDLRKIYKNVYKNPRKFTNKKESKETKETPKVLKKDDLIVKIKEYTSVLKIQRFYRNKKSTEQVCPISMESIKYPCFAFRPKGHSMFIYYNLEPLVSYMLSSGNFKDPKTREEYSDQVLESIDKEVLKNKIPLMKPFKSVIKASKNKKYYRKKKDNEDTILALERCLDDIIGSMRSIIEQRIRRVNPIQTLNSLFFMAFRTYFRRLVSLSKESGLSLIERTIVSINGTIKADEDFNSDTNIIRDNIIQFLYQIKYDEIPE